MASTTASTTAYRARDPLLQPYTLKHLVLKNRLMSTAHEPNYAEDGLPKERYRLYHAEKARGGIGLTMTAGSAVVSRDSAPAFGNLHAWSDDIVPWLKQLADACHEHGAAVMIQLTHLGRRTNWNKADWLPVLAPSPVREPAHRAVPKEIEDWDIARIVRDYAAAAARMQAAGLDGIELECYGHLIDQFWSPATNLRGDAYGGALDNRLAFAFQVLAAVREAVGPDFIVGCRLVADEDWDKGLTREEGLEICRRLVASGRIDFLNVIRGHIEHDAGLARVIPVTGMASAPHLEFAGAVRAETKFPVFHAARIADVATARHAIAEGKLDLVGMTRAHIADPHIALKVAQGREAEIRPCVGATYCLDRIYEGHETLCIHNAATGREATMPHVITRSGARPAGRGGSGRRPGRPGGGARRWRARPRRDADRGGRQARRPAAAGGAGEAPGRDHRHRRLAHERAGAAGRERALQHLCRGAEEVRALDPEIVVVATGGLPDGFAIEEGAELAVSSWDILAGDAKPADDVLLFDDNGAHPGMAAAEVLVGAGARLEIVSPERYFAPEMGGLNIVPYMQSLHRAGVTITPMTRVSRLRREGNKIAVTLWSPYSEAECGERIVDQVVVEQATLPLDELYFALKEESANRGEVDYEALVAGRPQAVTANPDGRFRLYRIGDAVAARNVHAAIYDALRLCKDF
jgi:N-methyl-L-proline demethylase